MRRLAFGLVPPCAALLLLATPDSARACGLSPPIGPNGLPAVCYGDDHVRMRAGLTAGGTSTTIEFGDEEAELVQGAVAATYDIFPLDRLSLSATLGTSIDGHVEYLGTRYDLEPGVLGGLGISYRLFGGKVPFAHVSANFSLARSTSVAPDGSTDAFTSRDWRLGLAVGHAIGGWAAPFVVARYFGAGTDWNVAGGKGADKFRYHVGLGSGFALSEHFDLLGEIAFLGEQRVSLGVGYAF